MNYLEVQEVLDIHNLVLARSGGMEGIRNMQAIK
jgi:hypothetical protein